MRTIGIVGLFLATVTAAPLAFACDVPGGQGQVQIQIVIDPPSVAATAQSQAFQTEATRLDGKASVEETASATVLVTARGLRKRAASIRVQAGQVGAASQAALLAKADKLDAEAATHDAASVTFLARAKLIRARAKALRILSARVLTSGAISAQVLAKVQLPAPPSGHPDGAPLKVLDAVPKAAGMMHTKAQI